MELGGDFFGEAVRIREEQTGSALSRFPLAWAVHLGWHNFSSLAYARVLGPSQTLCSIRKYFHYGWFEPWTSLVNNGSVCVKKSQLIIYSVIK